MESGLEHVAKEGIMYRVEYVARSATVSESAVARSFVLDMMNALLQSSQHI